MKIFLNAVSLFLIQVALATASSGASSGSSEEARRDVEDIGLFNRAATLPAVSTLSLSITASTGTTPPAPISTGITPASRFPTSTISSTPSTRSLTIPGPDAGLTTGGSSDAGTGSMTGMATGSSTTRASSSAAKGSRDTKAGSSAATLAGWLVVFFAIPQAVLAL